MHVCGFNIYDRNVEALTDTHCYCGIDRITCCCECTSNNCYVVSITFNRTCKVGIDEVMTCFVGYEVDIRKRQCFSAVVASITVNCECAIEFVTVTVDSDVNTCNLFDSNVFRNVLEKLDYVVAFFNSRNRICECEVKLAVQLCNVVGSGIYLTCYVCDSCCESACGLFKFSTVIALSECYNVTVFGSYQCAAVNCQIVCACCFANNDGLVCCDIGAINSHVVSACTVSTDTVAGYVDLSVCNNYACGSTNGNTVLTACDFCIAYNNTGSTVELCQRMHSCSYNVFNSDVEALTDTNCCCSINCRANCCERTVLNSYVVSITFIRSCRVGIDEVVSIFSCNEVDVRKRQCFSASVTSITVDVECAGEFVTVTVDDDVNAFNLFDNNVFRIVCKESNCIVSCLNSRECVCKCEVTLTIQVNNVLGIRIYIGCCACNCVFGVKCGIYECAIVTCCEDDTVCRTVKLTAYNVYFVYRCCLTNNDGKVSCDYRIFNCKSISNFTISAYTVAGYVDSRVLNNYACGCACGNTVLTANDCKTVNCNTLITVSLEYRMHSCGCNIFNRNVEALTDTHCCCGIDSRACCCECTINNCYVVSITFNRTCKVGIDEVMTCFVGCELDVSKRQCFFAFVASITVNCEFAGEFFTVTVDDDVNAFNLFDSNVFRIVCKENNCIVACCSSINCRLECLVVTDNFVALNDSYSKCCCIFLSCGSIVNSYVAKVSCPIFVYPNKVCAICCYVCNINVCSCDCSACCGGNEDCCLLSSIEFSICYCKCYGSGIAYVLVCDLDTATAVCSVDRAACHSNSLTVTVDPETIVATGFVNCNVCESCAVLYRNRVVYSNVCHLYVAREDNSVCIPCTGSSALTCLVDGHIVKNKLFIKNKSCVCTCNANRGPVGVCLVKCQCMTVTIDCNRVCTCYTVSFACAVAESCVCNEVDNNVAFANSSKCICECFIVNVTDLSNTNEFFAVYCDSAVNHVRTVEEVFNVAVYKSRICNSNYCAVYGEVNLHICIEGTTVNCNIFLIETYEVVATFSKCCACYCNRLDSFCKGSPTCDHAIVDHDFAACGTIKVDTVCGTCDCRVLERYFAACVALVETIAAYDRTSFDKNVLSANVASCAAICNVEVLNYSAVSSNAEFAVDVNEVVTFSIGFTDYCDSLVNCKTACICACENCYCFACVCSLDCCFDCFIVNVTDLSNTNEFFAVYCDSAVNHVRTVEEVFNVAVYKSRICNSNYCAVYGEVNLHICIEGTTVNCNIFLIETYEVVATFSKCCACYCNRLDSFCKGSPTCDHAIVDHDFAACGTIKVDTVCGTCDCRVLERYFAACVALVETIAAYDRTSFDKNVLSANVASCAAICNVEVLNYSAVSSNAEFAVDVNEVVTFSIGFTDYCDSLVNCKTACICACIDNYYVTTLCSCKSFCNSCIVNAVYRCLRFCKRFCRFICMEYTYKCCCAIACSSCICNCYSTCVCTCNRTNCVMPVFMLGIKNYILNYIAVCLTAAKHNTCDTARRSLSSCYRDILYCVAGQSNFAACVTNNTACIGTTCNSRACACKSCSVNNTILDCKSAAISVTNDCAYANNFFCVNLNVTDNIYVFNGACASVSKAYNSRYVVTLETCVDRYILNCKIFNYRITCDCAEETCANVAVALLSSFNRSKVVNCVVLTVEDTVECCVAIVTDVYAPIDTCKVDVCSKSYVNAVSVVFSSACIYGITEEDKIFNSSDLIRISFCTGALETFFNNVVTVYHIAEEMYFCDESFVCAIFSSFSKATACDSTCKLSCIGATDLAVEFTACYSEFNVVRRVSYEYGGCIVASGSKSTAVNCKFRGIVNRLNPYLTFKCTAIDGHCSLPETNGTVCGSGDRTTVNSCRTAILEDSLVAMCCLSACVLNNTAINYESSGVVDRVVTLTKCCITFTCVGVDNSCAVNYQCTFVCKHSFIDNVGCVSNSNCFVDSKCFACFYNNRNKKCDRVTCVCSRVSSSESNIILIAYHRLNFSQRSSRFLNQFSANNIIDSCAIDCYRFVVSAGNSYCATGNSTCNDSSRVLPVFAAYCQSNVFNNVVSSNAGAEHDTCNTTYRTGCRNSNVINSIACNIYIGACITDNTANV